MIEKKDIVISLITHYTNGNKAQFAAKLGVTPQTISTWISRNTFDADKIFANCENLSAEWLLTGKGEMLKPASINRSGEKSVAFGSFLGGKIDHIGDKKINHFHPDEGKNLVIEKQEKEVSQMFQILTDELHRFFTIIENHDEYVKRQDDDIKKLGEHLSNIVKQSYMRNERNMERLDKLISQHQSLIEVITAQSQQTQDRADRLLSLLEKKS